MRFTLSLNGNTTTRAHNGHALGRCRLGYQKQLKAEVIE